MKGYLQSFTLGCALLLTCAGCASTAAHRTAWEYKYIAGSGHPLQDLSDSGKQGWELVAVSEGGLFLKRPVQK